ncbi:rod shape-determining protein MreC, partial [Vibrio sp. 10N.222.48.A8]
VTAVDYDPKREFAVIKAEPVVEFDKLRYLLLVWPDENKQMQADQSSIEQALLEGEDGQ